MAVDCIPVLGSLVTCPRNLLISFTVVVQLASCTGPGMGNSASARFEQSVTGRCLYLRSFEQTMAVPACDPAEAWVGMLWAGSAQVLA